MQTNQVALTSDTVTQAIQNFLTELQAGGIYSQSAEMQQNEAIVISWMNAVTNSDDPLFNELQLLSETLLGGSLDPESSPLATCANALFTNWQTNSQKSPVDDRQYYTLIYSWVTSLIGLQTQAMQMIQAANQYQ